VTLPHNLKEPPLLFVYIGHIYNSTVRGSMGERAELGNTVVPQAMAMHDTQCL
jgi:hypothetical protein